MTKEQAYEQATLQNLSNPNGTRMDIIYAAMEIYSASEALRNESNAVGFMRWVANNVLGIKKEKWISPSGAEFTTEQLYSLYINSK